MTIGALNGAVLAVNDEFGPLLFGHIAGPVLRFLLGVEVLRGSISAALPRTPAVFVWHDVPRLSCTHGLCIGLFTWGSEPWEGLL